MKGTEQIQVTRLFENQRGVTERNNGGDAAGDTPQYNLMRSVGMAPVAGFHGRGKSP